MNDPVLVYKSNDNKKLLKIYRDDFNESPREWDNLGTIVYNYRDYILGDKQIDNWEDYLESEGLTENDLAVCLPIYVYDHSGISMKCGERTWPFNDQWDSSMVGFIYVTKERLRKEYSVKKLTKSVIDRARTVLVGEIETYNQYLNGEIYGYQELELHECNLGEEHEEEIDSCWGFYGQDGIQDILSQHGKENWIEC